jgi:acyl dehydratase
MGKRWYFEDFVVGETLEVGQHTFTEEEIITFAKQFDAQPFHIDPLAARDSAFRGLIASGWHTCSVMMSMVVSNLLGNSASMGSPGVDAIRWLRPVRPGDTLSVKLTVLASRLSASRPDRGIVSTRWQGFNQHGQPVVDLRTKIIVGRRPAASAAKPQA